MYKFKIVLFLLLSYSVSTFSQTAKPAKKPKTKKTASGLEYFIFTKNVGPKVGRGDLVFFKFKGMVSDSTLYNSYKNANEPYMTFPIQDSFPKASFEEGLSLLAKGDSAMLIINTDSFFSTYVGGPVPGFVKKGDPIFFYVKIDSFITKKVLEERRALEEMRLKEKQRDEVLAIDQFLTSTGQEFIRTPTGLYYNIVHKSAGPKALAGDKVGAIYTGKLLNGKVFDSNKESGNLFEFELGAHRVIAGWDEIFGILKEGEKAIIVIPSSLAYRERGAGKDIEPFTPLMFEVEFVKLTKAMNESESIKEYIKNTGLTFQTTATGLNYVITQTSNGPKAKAGDQVGAIYTGKLLSGKVFDSNKSSGIPFEFELGAHHVIAGWDEIFGILKEGEKATIVLPSSLGYGARGAGQDIKPNTPLVFDVEFIKLTKHDH